MQLVICACPKPSFNDDHIAIIQTNAIRSWKMLHPTPEIILYGSEEGTLLMAAALGTVHVSDVATNRWGTPLVGGILRDVQSRVQADLYCYVNADVILLPELIAALKRLHSWARRSVGVGGRTNLSIRRELDYRSGEWEKLLRDRSRVEGELEAEGVDYFVFPPGLYREMPEFAVGRPGFDNWMLWEARKQGIPVVDLTPSVLVIHQRHRSVGEWGRLVNSPEGRANIALTGIWARSYTRKDASHLLTQEAIKSRRLRAASNRVDVLVALARSQARRVARSLAIKVGVKKVGGR